MGSDLEQLLPAQVFSRRVKEARESLGWSQQQLVDELKRLGYPMPRSSLTKIENEHSPRADARLRDVLALASALRVPPVHLLVPLEDEATIAKALDVPEELIFGQSANETAPGEKEASPQARRRHQPELTPTSQRSASEH